MGSDWSGGEVCVSMCVLCVSRVSDHKVMGSVPRMSEDR